MIKLHLAVCIGMLAGATTQFRAAEYTPVEIGAAEGGDVVSVTGGYAVRGGGAGITSRSDQFHFGYEERSGDFDIRVRVAAVSITDPFVQAGLMARDSLDANAGFGGVFASSAELGCFFESRATVGAPARTEAPSGGFPVNYPQSWLRLRRAGNQFTGYGSFDGEAWQQLGSATLDFPSNLFFGMAVSSQNTNAVAAAQFRDLGSVSADAPFTHKPVREPIGPSNRRTGLVFSEIMYHPSARSDGKNLEFIELYNAESIFMDLTGWRLSGAVNYTFPAGFKLQAGEFAAVAASPAELENVYGITGVLGPYSGSLNNAGDNLKLLNAAGAVRLEVEYSPNPPWPVSADGAGHSLILARPSYGENDSRSWSPSERMGGTPGELEAILPNPWASVVVNEFLARTDDPVFDFVELYNASNAAVDISGCFLSDTVLTNRFRIPDGTVLEPRGFLSFNQNQLGFALNSDGETIYFAAADQSRIIDAVRFGGQENGISSGRSPDGSSTIRRLTAPTPGAANAAWRVEEIVINEIMYHSISDDVEDQYVELRNRSPGSVDLSGWRFEAGIDFEFPKGATIAPDGYVVVARNAVRLRSIYSQLTESNTFGDFGGTLSKSGERLALAKPDSVVTTRSDGGLATNQIHILVSEVSYVDGGRWPALADGGGSSLELIDSGADLLCAPNWAASDETQKAPWTTAEFTGRLDLGASGQSANRFYILALGASECLVDDVEIVPAGSTNLLANGSFENGSTGWSLLGNHSRSSVETAGAAAGQHCLHLRAPGDGNTGINSARANLTSTLRSGQTATIRAKVRWLSGWPELLFRVRGNWIEMPVRMDIPRNLGTPGVANSRWVNNAGPAIYDATHTPALPSTNEPVVVTCRVSDADGVAPPQLRFRIDPDSTYTTVLMRDDGVLDDALAGDGIYSATIPGQSSGTLAAFFIEASDEQAPAASSLFPDDAPTRECLIRWNDAIPFGTFAHYHLWSTRATETARTRSRALDNTYRDSTLVYGNSRVIYNAGFRDKGSPYHAGSGDFAVTVPRDNLVLGIDDRVFGSTGNGGNESTRIRGDVSGWIGEQMGIPFLHSHYVRLYRNGQAFRDILYDLEQPNRSYASSWFGGGGQGDELYKIAVWFEFDDSNSNFTATSATLERFLSSGAYKLARYRWNWQPRPSGMTVNNYTPIFNLAAAANNTADRITGMSNLADMEQWMRAFAYNRVLGNWDAWTFNVGQNMYLYSKAGSRAVLLPWDIDFVLGDGNGTSDALWGGQDPVMNQIFNLPVYRRMLWRAFQDAVAGPMQPENYGPQIDSRRAILLKNGLTGASDPRSLKTYLDGRRRYIESQLQRNDANTFAITSNGGSSFSTSSPVAQITGIAPFAVKTIEINGIPYPINWTGFTTWRIDVPLGAAANPLEFVGRDLRGQPVPGATANVTVEYSGAVARPENWIVINEIMYNPPEKNAEFLELFNRHQTTTFDLSGFRISGLDFRFPAGSFIGPNGYTIAAENRAAFAGTYGATIPVTGEYSGKLDNGGETLRLIKPGATEAGDQIINELRYDNNPPWPAAADGLGPSLQLIDPAQDNRRAGNWAITEINDVNRSTPGRANIVHATIDPFPSIWINEVLPVNSSGLADNTGEREPWIELYNAGADSIHLDGWSLTDDYAILDKWVFPTGAIVPANGFALVWADGEPNESSSGNPHANFRLRPSGGSVALARVQNGRRVVVDYLNYPALPTSQSFGSFTDGNPFKRQALETPTPGFGRIDPDPAKILTLEAALPFAGRVTLTWNAKAGSRYRLEAAADLSAPRWTTVFEEVATGATQSFNDVVTTAHRYYRLVME